MLVPSRKMVYIVDALAFRRARVESFLGAWARNENVELLSLDPDEAHSRLVERAQCDMLVYCVGAPQAHDLFTEIRLLNILRREATLAIVSDDENPATIVAAIRSGAKGYFSNSMSPDLALQALSFVLHGGTYFPPAVIMAGHGNGDAQSVECRQNDFLQLHVPPDLDQQHQAPPLGPGDGLYGQQGFLLEEKSTGVRRGNGSGGARQAPEFTERQHAVLACLCQGDPNKVIGRKLGMTEMTVKVHVREIMRKLGVSNRTQVAIAAGRSGFAADPLVETYPLNLAATIKSSVSH